MSEEIVHYQLHNGEAIVNSGELNFVANLSIRRCAWRIRVEIWNEPVKVNFD